VTIGRVEGKISPLYTEARWEDMASTAAAGPSGWEKGAEDVWRRFKFFILDVALENKRHARKHVWIWRPLVGKKTGQLGVVPTNGLYQHQVLVANDGNTCFYDQKQLEGMSSRNVSS